MTPAEMAAAGYTIDDILDAALGADPTGPRDTPYTERPKPPGYHEWVAEVAATRNPLDDEVMDTQGLSSIPPNPHLVRTMLSANSLAWIAGTPGAFKTFLAVELACCVATGTPYRSLEAAKGPTLYVTGEGRNGLYRRIQAWETTNNKPATDTYWLPSVVQVNTTRWDNLRDLAKDMGAVMVVLDTQARMAGALEENSAADMGRYIQAVDRLRESTGACVVSLHHSSKAGETLRGSSAVHGAADTVIGLTRMRTDDVDACRVHCMKQKDDTEFPDYWVRPVVAANSITLMECEKPQEWDSWMKSIRRG